MRSIADLIRNRRDVSIVVGLRRLSVGVQSGNENGPSLRLTHLSFWLCIATDRLGINYSGMVAVRPSEIPPRAR